MTPHLSPLLLISTIAAIAALAAFYAWTSRINQFCFFGRTLPLEFADSSAARPITKRYVGAVLIAAGVSILAFTLLYTVAATSCYLAVVTGIVLEVILLHVAFAWAHYEAGIAAEAFQRNSAHSESEADSNPPQPATDRSIAVSLLPVWGLQV